MNIKGGGEGGYGGVGRSGGVWRKGGGGVEECMCAPPGRWPVTGDSMAPRPLHPTGLLGGYTGPNMEG